MRNLKITLILLFGLLLFNVSAQTLTSSGNHKITGTWTFENGITVRGGKSFLTDGLRGFVIKNNQLGAALTVGIAEGNGQYAPGNKSGDITIRRSGGPSRRLIITNTQTQNYPGNEDAVTGIMGAMQGGGVWAHNNGFVRIGNYNVVMPRAQLQVEGEGRFITTNEGVNYLLRVGGNTHLKGNAFGISFDPEGYKDGYIKRSKIAIVVEGDGSGWSRGKLHILQRNTKDFEPATIEDAVFTIDQNGKVGIGTTSPNTKLDVNGTIRANEIKVTTAPGADFVFDADYSLRTLDEVENFINENNHLPEIPTALDMETNGVELTKMNQLLLMKIEELTLYLIEQKKEIKELNALVNTFVSESK